MLNRLLRQLTVDDDWSGSGYRPPASLVHAGTGVVAVEPALDLLQQQLARVYVAESGVGRTTLWQFLQDRTVQIPSDS